MSVESVPATGGGSRAASPAGGGPGRGSLRQVTMEATVLGPCKHCGSGAEFWPDVPCFGGETHEPTFTRPLGVVARWHRSRAVRMWWAIEDKIRRSDHG